MMVEPPPLREKVHAIPVELHTLVHEMMAKTATARPAMAQVVARLDSIKMGGQGTAAASLTRRRSLRPLLIGATAFIVMGIGAGLVFLRARQSPRMSAAATLDARAGANPGPGSIPSSLPDEHPSAGLEPAHDPAESDELKSHLQKGDKLKKHKLQKPAPALKEGHPAQADSSLPVQPSATPPAKARSKLTDTDIEPDR
jgi:hypothetical protein